MNSPLSGIFPFRRVLTLDGLVEFWRHQADDEASPQRDLARNIVAEVERTPEITGTLPDVSVLERHHALLARLMSAVFPLAHGQDLYAAAVVPYEMTPLYSTEGFDRLRIFENLCTNATVAGISVTDEEMAVGKAMTAYQMILTRYYHVPFDPVFPLVFSAVDEENGLERYYRVLFDTSFVEFRLAGELPELTPSEIDQLLAEPMNLALWREKLPPERFELHGFVVVTAVDVTPQEVHSALKNDLLQKDAFTSPGSIDRLERRLRTLLRLPRMRLGLIGLTSEDFDALGDAFRIGRSLLFSQKSVPDCPARHKSVYADVFKAEKPIVVADLEHCRYCTGFEHHLVEQEFSSLMLVPLRFEGHLIGLMELASPRKGAMTAMNAVQLMEVISLFSTAMRRTLDEQEDRVQALMKARFTAIHPAVEWRFRRSVLRQPQLTQENRERADSVVFEDVHPLYGLSDIRSSSQLRSSAIQADLVEQLGLALAVIVEAGSYAPLPALDELGFRIHRFVETAESSPTTDIEITALEFLKHDVEPLFEKLASFGPSVGEKIERYRASLDDDLGILYRRRRDYEESVSLVNRTIAEYLDRQQQVAQSMFPHYFEKYQSDGVDYNMYIGASIVEGRSFDPLYLRNLRLWQLMTTCGIVWRLAEMQDALKVPLQTAHLILAQNTPLSIRFREDEKKFDVDGAYNVRYEIVKKRIDKARVRGTGERLTQPGHIAIVYSQSREAAEYRRYLEYLMAAGYFVRDSVEDLLLEDLPGVQGLRALRVTVSDTAPDMETIIKPDGLAIGADLAESADT